MLLNILVLSFFHTVNFTYASWKHNLTKYTIYEVTAFNTRERAILYNEQITNDAVVFLNGVSNIVSSPMYVIVSDCCISDFIDILDENGIEYIQVLKDSVLKEFKDIQLDNIDDDDWKDQQPPLDTEFLDWDEIKLWVRYELKKFPSLRKIIIGDTYEGKELFILKISAGAKKPAIFIMGGEQGRDKMSVSVILSFVNTILTTKLYVKLTNVYDLYLMPVFNPDGYEYSMKSAWFWNKNRKVFYPEKICPIFNERAVGVNTERNWFMTNSTHVEGAECASVFLGHEALTEEEPRSLAIFLNSMAENLMAFINVRGYGSLITVPYATANEFANNYAVLSEMLLHASNAAFIQYNVSCNLCSTHNCFYNDTGNAPDWVKKNLNVPIVFTLYLKHVDSFLPRIEQMPTLLLQFGIIIKETLLLAYDIYGPLFSCASQASISLNTVSIACLVQCLRTMLD